MKSKRANEGYLLMDHSASPGIDPELIRKIGDDLPFSIGRCKFEAPTYTCSHCQVVVVLNPLRKRERAYCPGCDHYLCDRCGAARAAGAVCRTFKEIVEKVQEQAQEEKENV